MTCLDVMKRPLARAVLVLVTVVIIVGVVRPSTAEPLEVSIHEPYTPFRMTYISHYGDDSSITTELTWRSRLSWYLVVIAATEHPDLVGSYNVYDHGLIASYNAMVDEYTTESGADGSNGEFEIPKPWLIPRAFAEENGWVSLGRGPDGYDHFRRTLGSGAEQYHEIYKRDPQTGLVMEVERVKDSESVITAKVITYTPLATE